MNMVQVYKITDFLQDAQAKRLAEKFYYDARQYVTDPEADPVVYYHLGQFTFSPGNAGDPNRSRLANKKTEVIFNKRTLNELITEYPKQNAVYIMAEVIRDVITEKSIFGV